MSAPEFLYQLGDQVEDRITGLVGTVTARVQHITGCNQYGVTPRLAKGENKVPEFSASFVDEHRLIVLKTERIVLGAALDAANKRGAGPNPSTTNHRGLR